MAQFHGMVGFVFTDDNETTGISSKRAVEKPYYGKIKEQGRRYVSTDHRNDDIELDNVIKITANDYAFKNHKYIAYVLYMGCYWSVESLSIKQ